MVLSKVTHAKKYFSPRWMFIPATGINHWWVAAGFTFCGIKRRFDPELAWPAKPKGELCVVCDGHK